MQSHKDMDVWKKAIDFAEEVYTITRLFPKEEQYGLVSQLRRAVISISSNIAEGASRNTRKDYIRFLYIARASASEMDTLLEISKRTIIIEPELIENARENNIILIKILTALIKSLRISRANLNFNNQ